MNNATVENNKVSASLNLNNSQTKKMVQYRSVKEVQLFPSSLCLSKLTLDKQDLTLLYNEVVWLSMAESVGVLKLKPLA